MSDRRRVWLKSPVRENRPPGSVRGAPGNRRPYRDKLGLRLIQRQCTQPTGAALAWFLAFDLLLRSPITKGLVACSQTQPYGSPSPRGEGLGEGLVKITITKCGNKKSLRRVQFKFAGKTRLVLSAPETTMRAMSPSPFSLASVGRRVFGIFGPVCLASISITLAREREFPAPPRFWHKAISRPNGRGD